MTTQHVLEVPVLIEDPVVLAQVKWAVDELDTTDATRYAIDHAVSPPSEAPGWMLCQRFDPDGSEGPLTWVLVTETEQSG